MESSKLKQKKFSLRFSTPFWSIQQLVLALMIKCGCLHKKSYLIFTDSWLKIRTKTVAAYIDLY